MKRFLFACLVACIIQAPAAAQVSLSLSTDRALPGEPISVSCSLQMSEDYAPNRVIARPFLLTKDGQRLARGGVGGSDHRRSKGGYLTYTRAELLAGDCGDEFAPLVPGSYEYEVIVGFYDRPDERLFTLSITVEPLPPQPGILKFEKMGLRPHYGYRQAMFTLAVPDDRCFPLSLNPAMTELVVFDATTGRRSASLGLGGHLEYRGQKEQAIDQYNCLPTGLIADGIPAPDADAPGDWHLAVIVRDRKTPLCDGECRDGAPLNVDEMIVVATAPIMNVPAEPDGDFYFERVTDKGTRRSAEAAIGDRVRIVMEKPKGTTERFATITAERESKRVELKPDGHLLASDWFILGLPEDAP